VPIDFSKVVGMIYHCEAEHWPFADGASHTEGRLEFSDLMNRIGIAGR
jgi:hypothetical protein